MPKKLIESDYARRTIEALIKGLESGTTYSDTTIRALLALIDTVSNQGLKSSLSVTIKKWDQRLQAIEAQLNTREAVQSAFQQQKKQFRSAPHVGPPNFSPMSE